MATAGLGGYPDLRGNQWMRTRESSPACNLGRFRMTFQPWVIWQGCLTDTSRRKSRQLMKVADLGDK